MKTLFLVRHAKAANRNKHLSDIERQLTPRGEKDAKRAAKVIKAQGVVPDQIISSPANRALETAHILARELGYSIQGILLKQAVYDVRDADGLYGTLREIEDQFATAIVVGHNPSLEDLAASLVPGFSADIPKAGVIQIQLNKDSWRDVLPGDGTVEATTLALKKSRIVPNEKELRRQINEKIAHGLTIVLNEISEGGAQMLEPEINKAATSLARRIVKLERIKRTD